MDEISVLTQAMKLEKESYEFYDKAAGQVKDAKTAEMFKSLADDERHHFAYLERQLKEREAGRAWLAIPELDSVKAFEGKKPVFPEGVEPIDALPQNPSEEDALLFGMGTEISSFEMYREKAAEVGDAHGEKMFEKLADAEMSHFETLMMRYEAMFGYPR